MALIEALHSFGLSFWRAHRTEVRMAELVNKFSPRPMQMLRMVNSVLKRLWVPFRLARGYTKRNKILSLKVAYGPALYLLFVESGSGCSDIWRSSFLACLLIFAKLTLTVEFNNLASVAEAL